MDRRRRPHVPREHNERRRATAFGQAPYDATRVLRFHDYDATSAQLDRGKQRAPRQVQRLKKLS